MVRQTVHKVGEEIQKLSKKNMPLDFSLNLLEHRAETVEELVVIGVIREVCREMNAMESTTMETRLAS